MVRGHPFGHLGDIYQNGHSGSVSTRVLYLLGFLSTRILIYSGSYLLRFLSTRVLIYSGSVSTLVLYLLGFCIYSGFVSTLVLYLLGLCIYSGSYLLGTFIIKLL